MFSLNHNFSEIGEEASFLINEFEFISQSICEMNQRQAIQDEYTHNHNGCNIHMNNIDQVLASITFITALANQHI
jgi:hypothetical protein